MHASTWKFTGNTDDLARRYDALLDEMPTTEFIAHLCLRAPDGIVIVDTCPTREAFEAFATGEGFRSALRRHGLPDPTTQSMSCSSTARCRSCSRSGQQWVALARTFRPRAGGGPAARARAPVTVDVTPRLLGLPKPGQADR